MRKLCAIAASAIIATSAGQAYAKCTADDLDGKWEWYAVYHLFTDAGGDVAFVPATEYCILEIEDRVIEDVNCIGGFTDLDADQSEERYEGVTISFSSRCRLTFSDNFSIRFKLTMSPKGLTAAGVGQPPDGRASVDMIKR